MNTEHRRSGKESERTAININGILISDRLNEYTIEDNTSNEYPNLEKKNKTRMWNKMYNNMSFLWTTREQGSWTSKRNIHQPRDSNQTD